MGIAAAVAEASAVGRTGRIGRVPADWIEAAGKDWSLAEVPCLRRGLRCVEEPAAEIVDREPAVVVAAVAAADIEIVVAVVAVRRRSPVEVGRRQQATVLVVFELEIVRAMSSVGRPIVVFQMDLREQMSGTEFSLKRD